MKLVGVIKAQTIHCQEIGLARPNGQFSRQPTANPYDCFQSFQLIKNKVQLSTPLPPKTNIPNDHHRATMTGDKIEVHNEPSSILSDGQLEESNGTAQSHSQQSTQANTNHNCKNNWWNCCCCCCSW